MNICFEKLYLSDIERHYDLKIDSIDERGYHKAHIYIGANKADYDRLLFISDKCEFIEPRHVREYIINKVEAIMKVYNK